MTDSSETKQHPKLTEALAAMERGDPDWPMAILGIGLRARLAADEDGRYCECADPLLTGLDLMCGACLFNNRDQEIRRLLSIYGAHEFELDTSSPTKIAMRWCKCTWPEDDPRHHGEDKPMRTSWGERFTPPHDALRARYDG